jgi:hypothetical protein
MGVDILLLQEVAAHQTDTRYLCFDVGSTSFVFYKKRI